MPRSRKRKKFQTTKNTQPSNSTDMKNVFDINDLSKITNKFESELDGKSFGIILNINTNNYGNWVTFSMMKLDTAIEIAEKYQGVLEKHNYDDCKFFGDCILTEFEENREVTEPAHRTMVITAINSYINQIKENLHTIHNLWVEFKVQINYDEKTYGVDISAQRLSSFQSFKNRIKEIGQYEEDIIDEIKTNDTTIDDTEKVVNDADYSVDDIIIDEDVIPIKGVKYDVLSKLKTSMSLLEIGQTIKLPKNDRLRSAVYTLNTKYFPEKRFSCYDGEDKFVVFLNNNKD